MPDPDQYQRALSRGTPVRVAIGAAKRAIATGEVSADDALNGNAPDHALGIDRCPVRKLVEAVPTIGPATAKEILIEAGVDLDSRVGDHGYATRGELAALIKKATEGYLTETAVVPDESWREAGHG